VEFELETLLTFAGPVCAVAAIDINNDGLDELVIVTTDKLHVLRNQKLTGLSDAQELAEKVRTAAEIMHDILTLQAEAAM
jgi:hypothetical protein